ncbi:unnamed protein product [Rhizoctonia solani]|uniref:Homeobox domain-containing protein n=1 Tax=Rhizoctonia solani TaxID=456999 RepID=A0A8H3C4N2_9AGAM|nr:unnamed protein product [Rhizoctonia solani]
MAPRREDEDENEDLSYLPGSGPSMPEYGFEYAPPPGFVTAFWNPYEVKHRRRTSRAQLGVLEREFETDPKPNADKRRSLAAQLNMTPRAIQVSVLSEMASKADGLQVWFQNRRAKIKAIKNKIPGGRGMPKLKPSERAARKAASAEPPASPEASDETHDWVQLSPEQSPSSSPNEPGFSSEPKFTISVPESVSGPASPSFPPPAPSSAEMLAPPSAAMLRRGSAPAPLQGIHRARYSVFNKNEDAIPASPISPPDHEVAPVRRASAGLARRPSLPDSHLRLPAHPYYPHAGAPRMQRRTALLSPVPDVGQEQEQATQYPPLPTMLPPAPAVGSSRIYRALPPGMGAVPAAHDLPTQLPARPSTTWTPQRPFTGSVPGPLPAADFSFGAPEPGHGDAFNRVMNLEGENSEYTQEFTNHSQEFDYPQMWDARTRFGSMASIASDVTGVSVSSTQATSVSGGLGTATFNNECPPYGYPSGFQPDLRRASCPGEFLHQFSGMGVASTDSAPVRPSPLGRSLTIAPDSRGMINMVNDAKSLRSPTFPPGQVDPTYPPPPPEQGEGMVSGQQMVSPNQPMVSPQHMSPTNQSMISPTNQAMSTNQAMISPSSQSMLTPNSNQSMMSQQHMAQTNLSPTQRSLVGGGFGYEQYSQEGYRNEQNGYGNDQNGYGNQDGGYTNGQEGGYTNSQDGYANQEGYRNEPTRYNDQSYSTDPTYDSQPYVHTPPSFQGSPAMSGVPVLGTAPSMEIINLNKPVLFTEYDMMMNHECRDFAYT